MKGEKLKKLKVRISNFKFKDMLQFKNMPLRRDKAIEQAEDKDIVTSFPINNNARLLHPETQKMVVSKIIERPEAGARTLILRTADGSPAAWFRAGQYVSLKLKIGDSCVTRPYSISSSPKLTKEGKVCITVKRTIGGFVSDHLIYDVKEGDAMTISGPDGFFYHDRLRDSRNVVAIAGGSGITPFLSMAYAIRDSIEDFNLTILFGSRTEDSILFKNELDMIQNETDKVKVIHVLSDENRNGYEHGFMTADLIRRYAPEGDYSLFICGPEGLYNFMDEETRKLNLPLRRVRREITGAPKNVDKLPDYPAEAVGKIFNIKVIQGPCTYEIKASSSESVLCAIERAGILAPSKCRSGECGWCRSKLLSGSVYIPEKNEARRRMDRETDHIHPCISFPLSDIVLEVPRGDFPL